MKNPFLLLSSCLMLLSACVHPNPPAAPAGSRTEILLEAHSQQIAQLQEHIIRLEAQLQQLQTADTPVRNTPSPTPPAATNSQRPSTAQILAQAQSHRQNNRPNQALQQLKQLERHNLTDNQAAQALHLRVQIHNAQKNCQSLIIAGQQLTQRFPRHPFSADALLHIGQCQWQMQQRDIARNTWRRLIHSHPDSTAAKEARRRLENPSP